MEQRLLTLFKEANNLDDTLNDTSLYCSRCLDWLTEWIYVYPGGKHYCRTCRDNNSEEGTGIRDTILEGKLSRCHYPCKRMQCSYWLPWKSIQHHTRNCSNTSVSDQLVSGGTVCPVCNINQDTRDFIEHFDREHILRWNYGVITIQVSEATYIYANDKLCQLRCRLIHGDFATKATVAFTVEIVHRNDAMAPSWTFVVQIYDRAAKAWSDIHLSGKVGCHCDAGAAKMVWGKKDLQRFVRGEHMTIRCCIIGE